MEIWKDIPGHEGRYEASSLGRVRSLDRQSGKRSVRGKILVSSFRGKYAFVSLMNNYQKSTRTVHSLILETFVGPRPHGFDGCHNNGIPSDNRLENLRWASRSDNVKDSIAHGTFSRNAPCGERSNLSKLVAEDVLRIREATLFGARQKDLASIYGLERTAVQDIVHRNTWVHL